MALRLVSIFLLSALSVFYSQVLSAAVATTVEDVLEFYGKVRHLPSATLMDMATAYQRERHMPDSAIYCLTAVSERYSEAMNAGEKQMCIDALNQQYHILSFSQADYSRSMDCLNKALEISRTLEREQPRLYFNLGTFHQVSAIQTKSQESNEEACRYYKQAFDMAERQQDGATLTNIFPNLLYVLYFLDNWPQAIPYVERYRQFPVVEDTVLRRYNLLMADALEAQRANDTLLARRIFEQQIAALPDNMSYARQLMMAHHQAGVLQMDRGNYASACAHFMKQLDLARRYAMPQIEFEVYRNLSILMNRQNRPAEGERYRVRYLEMKDSLLNERITRNVSVMQFVGELQKYSGQLRESRHRQKVLVLWVAGILAFLVAAVTLIVTLYRRNRRLRETNSALYEKTQLMLQREGTLPLPVITTLEVSSGTQTQSVRTARESTAEMDLLYAKIQDVLNNNAEVLQPGFNMMRMAELTGSNSSYVSKAVNTIYGQGFAAMLSERRVREACIRISDTEHYGHLTLDAIMNEVGIKSRTSFTAAFKRVTGLTPSEYKQQAQRRSGADL